ADGSEMAYNLVPSYHCLISAYCYLGVRKQPEISKGFRVYSLIMAILISISTVCTKQHYIIDVVTGVGISIGCYLLMNRVYSDRD
ncbi:MAG: phosphatase PAP2 family protein, partial [Erysipelotrichaceae bacterium]|nr:phosphatase PAP2 family protein [Erysipelotrichaceae bacterium]